MVRQKTFYWIFLIIILELHINQKIQLKEKWWRLGVSVTEVGMKSGWKGRATKYVWSVCPPPHLEITIFRQNIRGFFCKEMKPGEHTMQYIHMPYFWIAAWILLNFINQWINQLICELKKMKQRDPKLLVWDFSS